MLRRVLTMVADCDQCHAVSKPFTFISKGGSSDNCPDSSGLFEHLPFGWAELTTSGWGPYDRERTHLICPECVEKVSDGEVRLSKKGLLDGLAEV